MKKKSQKDRILAYLKSGHLLTPLQALRRFGSLRLGALIFDLRHKEGYNIETELITIGNHKNVARYKLIAR